ncbi:MAG: DinB family protein [Armatimonadetes bacterium]|nr:DinB family protein [Armatimonadota bacterium]
MLDQDLLKSVRENIQMAGANTIRDIQALSEEALSKSPGGGARAPYDYVYECVVVNQRLAKRMRGEDPGDWPFQGWAKAPEDFKSIDAAVQKFQESLNDLVTSLGDDVNRVVPTSEGDRPIWDLGQFAAIHMFYHDGQLNMVQAMHGDEQVHWD